jgi:hypothetical protein
MGRIFLSASVPLPGRGDFYETANPFLIQFAVRELLTVCLGRRQIVWGGHPAITPMVWAVCEDLGVEYADAVLLYQSSFFQEEFPEENEFFSNVIYVEAEPDRVRSLQRMREKMLSEEFEAAVFIGGMEGIFEEYEMFVKMHPGARVVAVDSAGGAAKQLAYKLNQIHDRIDYARMFYKELNVDIAEQRDQFKRSGPRPRM